jgi:hypothetical protein
MACHVHSHGVHRGAAACRVRDYRRFFGVLHEHGVLQCDVSGMDLALDDEDVRYTTDAEPGVYCKLAALEWLFREHGPRDEVRMWDLYAAPGMDVVYCMLVPGILSGVRVRVVGVSIVRDAKDEERFERMQRNADSVRASFEECGTVELVRSSALQFCQGYTGRSADVVMVSMPWMTTMGEFGTGGPGVLREPSDMMAEAVELLRALRERGAAPRVVLLMVPFDDSGVSRVEGYDLLESISISKYIAETRRKISCYYTHVLSLRRGGCCDIRDVRHSDFRYFVQ